MDKHKSNIRQSEHEKYFVSDCKTNYQKNWLEQCTAISNSAHDFHMLKNDFHIQQMIYIYSTNDFYIHQFEIYIQ